MGVSRNDYHRIYRSDKLSLYKKLARMILEQAMEDLMCQGTPKDERVKWHKDAKAFFENADYELFCDCAEIDVLEMDKWYQGLEEKK